MKRSTFLKSLLAIPLVRLAKIEDKNHFTWTEFNVMKWDDLTGKWIEYSYDAGNYRKTTYVNDKATWQEMFVKIEL